MPTLLSLTNRMLRVAKLQLAPLPKNSVAAPPTAKSPGEPTETHLERLKGEPLNAQAHLDHAQYRFEREQLDLAFAELRTALFLGAPPDRATELADRLARAFPPLEEMDHNVYYRLHSMAAAIHEMAPDGAASVLDVGGGSGGLARFIPTIPYCLADPGFNGIAGEALPFADGAFDLVVSCHVLEHIPQADRDAFLDSLVAKSERGVVLLNPFHTEGTHEIERMQLIVDVMKASWAKEHLDCILPRTEEVADYARRRGLGCVIRPNASMTTSFSVVWAGYFAGRARAGKEFALFNRFMNTRLIHAQDSTTTPTAYMVLLTKPRAAN